MDLDHLDAEPKSAHFARQNGHAKNYSEAAASSLSVSRWRRYVNSLLAGEISAFSRYYDQIIHFNPRANDTGVLLEQIDCPRKVIVPDQDRLPDLRAETDRRTLILLNGNINHEHDIQKLFTDLREKLSRTSRLVLVAYNPYFRWLYTLANRFGYRTGEQPDTFVTSTDLSNLARLSGFELVRERTVAYCPWALGGLGNVINRILPAVPLLRILSLTQILVLRPIIADALTPTISVVIPARNEKGNIENALKRMPLLGGKAPEVIFVEGNSKDNTWEEIQRVIPLYSDRFNIKAYQQTGKGKNDAVRLGFSKATGNLLTILDADLTMPPELLGRFYDAYTAGLADFINGSRLVYPMEGEAMRFLNKLGNVFFAKALSAVLGTRLGDSLCGTKLVASHDYQRIIAWRRDFGDFDPFGDFELLFPASVLALGVIDVPIRYRDRTYGSTNISRFRHGWMLLKMTITGLLRLKLGQLRKAA
jgi:hypothetical protein